MQILTDITTITTATTITGSSVTTTITTVGTTASVSTTTTATHLVGARLDAREQLDRVVGVLDGVELQRLAQRARVGDRRHRAFVRVRAAALFSRARR